MFEVYFFSDAANEGDDVFFTEWFGVGEKGFVDELSSLGGTEDKYSFFCFCI